MPNESRKSFGGSLVILMTATIRPPALPQSAAAVRLEEYRRALEFWLKHPDRRIRGVVFCDNSAASVESLRDSAANDRNGRPVEFISGAHNTIPEGMHYGYAEIGIVDHALRESTLLRQADVFAKATGRLTFPNFTTLLDRLPQEFDCAIDYYRAPRHLRGTYRARTQLMLFSPKFYEDALLGTRHTMRVQGISHIEEAIPAVLKPEEHRDAARCIFRWPVECMPSGVGGNGQRYDGLMYQAKSRVRGALRSVAPWWWK